MMKPGTKFHQVANFIINHFRMLSLYKWKSDINRVYNKAISNTSLFTTLTSQVLGLIPGYDMRSKFGSSLPVPTTFSVQNVGQLRTARKNYSFAKRKGKHSSNNNDSDIRVSTNYVKWGRTTSPFNRFTDI